MEVATFLTSNKEIYNSLERYILSYDELILTSKDKDTIYFRAKDTGKHEIYYHFNNNIADEFSYNFEKPAQKKIKKYFGGKEIYLVVFSFRRVAFFERFILNFISSLLLGDPFDVRSEILLDDPFKGLLHLNEFGELKSL